MHNAEDNQYEKLRQEKLWQVLQLAITGDRELQDIINLASQLCNKPIAALTLVDNDVDRVVVTHGIDEEEIQHDNSFCKYCIQQEGLVVVRDAVKDTRFHNNPMVHGAPWVRFYAGAPLMFNGGLKIGGLCVFDTQPGDFTDVHQKTLMALARQVVSVIELKLSQTLLLRQIEETEAKNASLRKIAQMQSHYIRQPLTSIMGLVDNIKDGYFKVDDEWIKMMIEASGVLDERIKSIVTESLASKDIKALRFSKMVEEIDSYAILLLDKDGNIENWNKGVEKIKGYMASEIIGKSFSIFYTDEDKNANRPGILLKHALKTGMARDEGWRVRKDGSKFWGSILITAIHNDNGEVIGFTKVTRDLTDVKGGENNSSNNFTTGQGYMQKAV